MVRQSDVVCRLGGEEFGIILPACDAELARGLADRITDTLSTFDFEAAGRITISVGLAHGPEHAMNPRELVACAEAAMMTAKARGKHQTVVFGEGAVERPDAPSGTRDGRSIADAAHCDYGRHVPGTDVIEESQVNVPLCYGSRVIGVLGISKLGLSQFDEDDVRLLEVLAGQASVALENARLYEAARREAESAKALLQFGRELATAQDLDEIFDRVVELSAAILGTARTSVWLQDPATGELVPRATCGYTEEERPRVLGWRFPRDVAERALAPAEPFAFDSSE